ELEEAISEMRQTLGLILWDQAKFEELLVIDSEGRVLSSTYQHHEDRSAAELAYFRHGLRTTHVQPVFMSPITERLTMVISTPIRNEHHQTTWARRPRTTSADGSASCRAAESRRRSGPTSSRAWRPGST